MAGRNATRHHVNSKGFTTNEVLTEDRSRRGAAGQQLIINCGQDGVAGKWSQEKE